MRVPSTDSDIRGGQQLGSTMLSCGQCTAGRDATRGGGLRHESDVLEIDAGGDEERAVRGELVGRGTEATDSSAGATGAARVYGCLISVFSFASAAAISWKEGTSHKRMCCSGSRRYPTASMRPSGENFTDEQPPGRPQVATTCTV